MDRKLKLGSAKLIIPVVILAFLALFPLLGPDVYYLSFGFILFTYIALACSWNIIGGYAGYLSFGHAAFFGIGAYTTAMFLIDLGMSPFYTCLIGGLLAGVFAGIVGYPVLRLKGPYFALATLCLGLAVPVVVVNLEATGSAVGLWMPLLPVDIFTNRLLFYEVMLGLALAIVLLTRWIEKSKFGLGLSSIREDEDTAQTLGVNATLVKMIAFMLSAFLVGIVGGIYAYYRTYIHPTTVFDLHISISIVLMAIFGGSRWWLGPVIGATILTVISEILTAFLGIPGEVSRIMYGLLLVLVIMFMPNGIMSFVQRRRAPQRKEGLVSQPEV